jgi:hypothetical protein
VFPSVTASSVWLLFAHPYLTCRVDHPAPTDLPATPCAVLRQRAGAGQGAADAHPLRQQGAALPNHLLPAGHAAAPRCRGRIRTQGEPVASTPSLRTTRTGPIYCSSYVSNQDCRTVQVSCISKVARQPPPIVATANRSQCGLSSQHAVLDLASCSASTFPEYCTVQPACSQPGDHGVHMCEAHV